MAFWDSLKAKTREMNTQLTTKAGQFKNKEFANGSMAMCALIAAADGSIDAAEQAKTMSLIRSNSVLSVFPPDELQQKFDLALQDLQRFRGRAALQRRNPYGPGRSRDVHRRGHSRALHGRRNSRRLLRGRTP